MYAYDMCAYSYFRTIIGNCTKAPSCAVRALRRSFAGKKKTHEKTRRARRPLRASTRVRAAPGRGERLASAPVAVHGAGAGEGHANRGLGDRPLFQNTRLAAPRTPRPRVYFLHGEKITSGRERPTHAKSRASATYSIRAYRRRLVVACGGNGHGGRNAHGSLAGIQNIRFRAKVSLSLSLVTARPAGR